MGSTGLGSEVGFLRKERNQERSKNLKRGDCPEKESLVLCQNEVEQK